MDNGEILAVGLPVHKHVVVARALDNDRAIAPHPPMVVQIVQEVQSDGVTVILMCALVRVQGKRV